MMTSLVFRFFPLPFSTMTVLVRVPFKAASQTANSVNWAADGRLVVMHGTTLTIVSIASAIPRSVRQHTVDAPDRGVAPPALPGALVTSAHLRSGPSTVPKMMAESAVRTAGPSNAFRSVDWSPLGSVDVCVRVIEGFSNVRTWSRCARVGRVCAAPLSTNHVYVWRAVGW